jgi:hypothetical protein
MLDAMAEPYQHALAMPVDAAEDPLYDAIAIAFVYAAWAAASMWLGERAGLVALVLATTALTVAALAGHSRTTARQSARPFIVEFATIILFCATALALSVLTIDAVT